MSSMETHTEYGMKPPQDLFTLADSVRTIMERMMVIDQSHPELRQAEEALKEIAQRLDALGRTGLQARMHPGIEPGPNDMRPYYAGNARRWHYNPMFPPMQVEREHGVLRATVTLGLAYEGPPGCVHGGLIAMLLDQVLGQANIESGIAAMTGTLSVRYRKPTPLLKELVIEAGPPEVVDGRKCITKGRIRDGDTVTAEGQGLVVIPNFQGKEGLPMMYRGE